MVPDYEAQLASEGLAPFDVGGPGLSRNGSADAGRRTYGKPAVDAYLAWARQVLRSTAFSSPYQRRVWELFAEGMTIAEIVEQLRRDPPTGERRYPSGKIRELTVNPTRHSVYVALRRVRSRAPLSPVPNPWLRSGTHKAAARGTALESLVTKVISRLRRVAADPSELQRLLEVHMVEKNGTVHYAKIKFIRASPLNIPGVPVSREFLSDIDGRPHAGGIDVTLDTTESNGKKARKRFTLPWHTIKQAEVEVETVS